MQYIKNLKVEDIRRYDYIELKGFKVSWTNHFSRLEDDKIVNYTGIEYHKRNLNTLITGATIQGFKEYYRLILFQFGRYDISKVTGYVSWYIYSKDLKDLEEDANKWVEGKLPQPKVREEYR